MISEAQWVLVGWLTFGGSHLLLAHPPIRARIVNKIKEDAFDNAFSLLAAFILVPFLGYCIIFILNKRKLSLRRIDILCARGKGILLWDLSEHILAYDVLRGSSLVCLGQSLTTPSPAEVKVEDNKPFIYGIVRITRHALFFSSVLFALGGIFDSVFLADFVFLIGYPIFFIIGTFHQDWKQKKIKPRKYFDQTSVLPFKAILEGRNSLWLALKEFHRPALAVSLLSCVFLHHFPMSYGLKYIQGST